MQSARLQLEPAKFKYRAPEPIFEGNYWEEINLNPGDNYQTPGNKYIGIADRLDRERKERLSIPLTFGETLTRRGTPPPHYYSLTMAEGGNLVN